MKEKGQVWIVFAGLLVLIGMFCVGLLVGFGQSRTPPSGKDITIIDGETIEERKEISTTTVNNCGSDVPSHTHEAREFVVSQIITIEKSGELDAGLKDFILGKIQFKYQFQNGGSFKIIKEFDFDSPAGMISIHKIEWVYHVKNGLVKVNEKEYPFNFSLPEIETYQSTEKKSCSDE
jgi:hypothetical protein